MTRVRKWLSRRLELSITYGELLAIILLVVLINIIWPGVPTWLFFVLGLTVSIAERAGRASGRKLGRWLRRKGTA